MRLQVIFHVLSFSYGQGGFQPASPRRLAYEIANLCTPQSTCLENELWECWYGINGETPTNGNNCKFSFDSVKGRYGWSIAEGAVAKVTWCASTILTGLKTECDSAPVNSNLDNNGACQEDILGVESFTLPKVLPTVTGAFEIAACYCKNYDHMSQGACVHMESYTQQFGVIYMWIAKVCDSSNVDSTCEAAPYIRVYPHQYFSLRLECPTGRCLANTNNMIKYVDYDITTDRPNWANQQLERNGCQQQAESPSVTWQNPAGAKHGGSSLAYKKWDTNQVRIDAPMGIHLDICFCNDACSDKRNFIKVGELRMAETMALARRSQALASGSIPALDTVTKPGTITFYGGTLSIFGQAVDPTSGSMWTLEAAINVISVDRKLQSATGKTLLQEELDAPLVMDAKCNDQVGYENTIWLNNQGPTSSAHVEYNAYPSGVDSGGAAQMSPPSQYLAFVGKPTSAAKSMAMAIAGTFALCYCAIISNAGDCTGEWRHASNVIIRGPMARVSPYYTDGGAMPPYREYKIPLDIPFQLDFEGYGFRDTDKIRLVPSTTACEDGLNPPGLTTHYKKGCAYADSGSQTCQLAGATDDIGLELLTSESTQIFGHAIYVYETYTEIEFDAEITDLIAEGDAITFNHETLLMGTSSPNVDNTNWNKFESYYAQRLSGIYCYADSANCADTYLKPNRVKYVQNTNDGTVKKRWLSIPVGQRDPRQLRTHQRYELRISTFAFNSNRGSWVRRNKASTTKELKGVTAMVRQNICWGIGANEYYAKAGEISFLVPDLMKSSTISLTSIQAGVEAPVILAFTIGRERTNYSSMDDTGTLELRIRFQFADDKLKPRLLQSTTDDFATDLGSPTQAKCGIMFKELWTNDVNGFPVPQSCHFTRLLTDLDSGSKAEREYIITFASRNGLRRVCKTEEGGPDVDCEYQIVVNAVASNVNVGDNLVSLYTSCTGCNPDLIPPVIEKGAMLAQDKTYVTSEKARFADVQGVTIMDAPDCTQTTNFANLGVGPAQGATPLQLRIKGQDGQYKIPARSSMKVFMWPLTQWAMEETASCGVACRPGSAGTRCETAQMSCVAEALVTASARFNVLKVSFPSNDVDFTPITSQASDWHCVQITGLSLPVGGFFPTQLGAEIYTEDLSYPSDSHLRWHPYYVETDALVKLWKEPSVGFGSVGKIVYSGRLGGGTNPFAAERNVVYVLYKFPVTVLGAGVPSVFHIRAPGVNSYACEASAFWADSDLPIWLITDDTDTQQRPVNLGWRDSTRVTYDGSACKFELEDQETIHIGQTILFELRTTNPTGSLLKGDPNNVWEAVFFDTVHAQSFLSQFIDLSSEVSGKWLGNVATVERLRDYNMQPAPPALVGQGASVPNYKPFLPKEKFTLNIFFQTYRSIGRSGKIWIDVPLGFNLGALRCSVSDLPVNYYTLTGSDTSTQLKRIPKASSIHECVTILSPDYSRAELRIGGFLLRDSYYGFQLHLEAPIMDAFLGGVYNTRDFSDMLPSDRVNARAHSKNEFRDKWFLWTVDSDGYPCEGTEATLRFNVEDTTDSAFGLYRRMASTVTAEIASYIPYSAFQQATTLLISQIKFENTDLAFESFTVMIPSGYAFQASTGASKTYTAQPPGTELAFPFEPQAVGSPQNVLKFQKSNPLDPNKNYAFSIQIHVPDATPRRTTNAVYVLFGDTVAATSVELDPVKVLINTYLSYTSNRRLYERNEMVFHIQTITRLSAPFSGIVIEGDANTYGFPLACGDNPPPLANVVCTSTYEEEISTMYLALPERNVIPLEPGEYRIVVILDNPETSEPAAGVWTIGTYTDVINKSGPIDMAARITGFVLNSAMKLAGMIVNQPTSEERDKCHEDPSQENCRDDRPDHANSLLFGFLLSQDVGSEKYLVLRGPEGYFFAHNCMDTLIVEDAHIFSPDSLDSFQRTVCIGAFPPRSCYKSLTAWSLNSAPKECAGDRNTATILIRSGLKADEGIVYAFRIGILSNPKTTPEKNKWSIEYNDESSEPFDSIRLATFTDASVNTMSRIEGDSAPVEFFLRPENTVPASGMIRITAPEDFTFAGENHVCKKVIFGPEHGVAYHADEVRCQILPNAHQILLYPTNPVTFVEAGTRYRLLVEARNPTSEQLLGSWPKGYWRIESFSEYTGEHGSASPRASKFLDFLELGGFPIDTKMQSFNVCLNEGGISGCDRSTRKGLEEIKDVIMSMQFNDDVSPTDVITIHGPDGFFFADDAFDDKLPCTGFEWLSGANPFGETEPKCECDEFRCTMKFTIADGTPVLDKSRFIMFHLDMKNPRSTPDWAANIWKVNHANTDGEMFSGMAVECWPIVPQIEIPEDGIRIFGEQTHKAAGQTTNLEIKFMPVSNARSIRIEVNMAEEEEEQRGQAGLKGFNFDYAELAPRMSGIGFSLSKKNTTGNVITLFGRMLGDTTVTFYIDTVTLPQGGGPTRWTFVTFQSQSNNPAEIADHLEDHPGLRVPGDMVISNQDFSSRYRNRENDYPVKSLFRARIGEEATIEFILTFTRDVHCLEQLRISSEGENVYVLKPSPFIVIGMGKVKTSVQLIEGTIIATLKPDGEKEDIAMRAGEPYQVIMKAKPLKGPTRWLIETTDGGVYPTNTNDQRTVGVTPVSTIVVTAVPASRSPPKAEVEIILTLTFEGPTPSSVLLVAPPNFSFPTGLSGCGIDCVPGSTFHGTGLNTAEIGWGSRVSGDSLRVTVFTPMVAPPKEDLAWFVEARRAEEVLGWGEDEGFIINPMRDVGIFYPAIADLEMTRVAIKFTTNNVDDGNLILIEQPEGFLIYCSVAGVFSQLSLPGDAPDCVDEPLVLTLSENLQRNTEYSLVLGVDTPSTDIPPEQNIWSVVVKNYNFIVVDARYAYPGFPLIPYAPQRRVELPIHSFTFTWEGPAKPNELVTITVGISFDDYVEGVHALLIEFPEFFHHTIKDVSSVVNNNKKFTVAKDASWVDMSDSSRLKLIVEETEQKAIIPEGTFSWTFQVLVPTGGQDYFPRSNFWLFSACSSDTCTTHTGDHILATFTYAGFNANEVSPQELLKKAIGAASRLSAIMSSLFVVLLLM